MGSVGRWEYLYRPIQCSKGKHKTSCSLAFRLFFFLLRANSHLSPSPEKITTNLPRSEQQQWQAKIGQSAYANYGFFFLLLLFAWGGGKRGGVLFALPPFSFPCLSVKKYARCRYISPFPPIQYDDFVFPQQNNVYFSLFHFRSLSDPAEPRGHHR